MTEAPCRSTSLLSAAAAPRRMGPKIGSRSSSVAKAWTNVGERKRSFGGTGGGGAGVAPVLTSFGGTGGGGAGVAPEF